MEKQDSGSSLAVWAELDKAYFLSSTLMLSKLAVTHGIVDSFVSNVSKASIRPTGFRKGFVVPRRTYLGTMKFSCPVNNSSGFVLTACCITFPDFFDTTLWFLFAVTFDCATLSSGTLLNVATTSTKVERFESSFFCELSLLVVHPFYQLLIW